MASLPPDMPVVRGSVELEGVFEVLLKRAASSLSKRLKTPLVTSL